MSNDESDIPSASECQKAIDSFVGLTMTDEALAQFYLQDHKWNVELALDAFYSENPSGASSASGQSSSLVDAAKISISSKPPDFFKLLSWNIDGLSEKNLKPRYQHIAKIIEENKYFVVFLQEVVSESLRYFEDTLENYNIISTADNGGDYFSAIFIRSGCIYLDDNPEVVPFQTSRMGRTLQVVHAHIGKAKLALLNTHLESTGDHSDERLKQLKLCFRYMCDEDPSEVTTIFGGDLNLRDKELDQLGGPPAMVKDLWNATGSRPECKFTWDMTRNTNLEFPGRFKPRSRFDRLYMRSTNPAQIKPIHFGLVGLERVPGTQSFPSDHWGIEVYFEIPANK